MVTALNPVLSGFYPDPSICRAGEDYYIVNSSFAYFPGVPIFHSKDLAHWEQVGNILDREEQLPLSGSEISEGIYAPSIRYNNGTYYMITTNVSYGGNFIVTAEKPEGPWSKPYYLGDEAKGIDPDLFFDTDGRCYYVGTRPNPGGVRYNGDWEIWIQELDLSQMKLTGESMAIWKGAVKDVIWPEGPHIYKIDGYYYLLHAEGGTGPEHSISVARSKELFKWFEGCPRNPVFTHRNLGMDYPVVYAGHGDLVDDGNGNWYI
ncbi:MAG: glycoside hydrolase family 43 protein, partial [Lachnospiraceae bacterium]|nr:glycoside hydrolase family 43 protein [Lachnospiraceae bacterium]